MTTRRLAQTLLVVAALVSTTITARAATVETKVRAVMRDRPAPSARIVDRVPSGKKLKLLGQSGNWIHVKTGNKDGWISASELKGMRGGASDEAAAPDANDTGDDDGPVRPLAKARGVRPEAWVSKSRYHDGEETKLIVSVNKAELFGRPSSTGAVLGILRRGEAVQLVKRSVDKKWVNIDIGGGETAWIEARAVKPGKVATETPPPDESAQEEAAPPPQITPEGAKRKVKLAKNEAPPPVEQQAEPEAPRKNRRMVKNEPPPEEEAPPPPKRRGNIEDETPPGLAPAKPTETRVVEDERPSRRTGKKKVRKIAARDESATAGGESTDAEVVRDMWTQRGKVYILPELQAGFAVLSQRFTSNGTTGALTNYNASTAALGAKVGFGIWGTAGKYVLLGGDASYTFAGISRFKVTQAGSTTPIFLGVSAHTIDGGVSGGVHFGVLGGLNIRLRVGGQMVLNLIQPSPTAKLPSDRILGLTLGLGIGVPSLVRFAGRDLGLAINGGALVPAQRAQTLGLEDGAQSSTIGGFFGGMITFVLMPATQMRYRGQLNLEIAYNYEIVTTHYTGPSKRLPQSNITVADRGSAQHLGTLGLGFYY